MATQIKPKASGSFTTITTTSTGVASDTSTGMPSSPTGAVHQACRAVNEWHNVPGNATTAARAQKIASAAGISIQEV